MLRLLISISWSVSQVGGAVTETEVETCGGFKEPYCASAAMVDDDFESIVHKCVVRIQLYASSCAVFLVKHRCFPVAAVVCMSPDMGLPSDLVFSLYSCALLLVEVISFPLANFLLNHYSPQSKGNCRFELLSWLYLSIEPNIVLVGFRNNLPLLVFMCEGFVNFRAPFWV